MKVVRFDGSAFGRRCTLDDIEALAAGRARFHNVHSQTERLLDLNTSSDRKIFKSNKERGYFFGSDVLERESKVNVLTYLWLEAAQRPITRIAIKRKFATVAMDLIGLKVPHSWQNTKQQPSSEIGGYVAYWGVFNYIEKIPKENAALCAEWLLQLYRKQRDA